MACAKERCQPDWRFKNSGMQPISRAAFRNVGQTIAFPVRWIIVAWRFHLSAQVSQLGSRWPSVTIEIIWISLGFFSQWWKFLLGPQLWIVCLTWTGFSCWSSWKAKRNLNKTQPHGFIELWSGIRELLLYNRTIYRFSKTGGAEVSDVLVNGMDSSLIDNPISPLAVTHF